jgi:uncharacterized protein GlcG (DUF336 family)
MGGVPVSIVEDGGFPVTNTDGAAPFTPVEAPLYAFPVTLVDEGGYPVTLINDDGTAWEPAE